MITAVAESHAEYDGYSPGCLCMGFGGEILGKLPLSAWPALCRWFDADEVLPLRFVDDFGQTVSITRGAVASIILRDLDTCVALQQRDADAAARRVVEEG